MNRAWKWVACKKIEDLYEELFVGGGKKGAETFMHARWKESYELKYIRLYDFHEIELWDKLARLKAYTASK
jgi:hypothetical protein